MKLFTFCTALLVPCALAGQDSSVIRSLQTSAFDLIITEIMADPDPSNGLPASEFVEVYNRSQIPINLTGWILFDGSSRILPSVNIGSGEFVIVCPNSDTAQFAAFGKYAGVSSLSLTNTGEKISIRDPFGNPIDSVTYDDAWYGPSFKKDGGWTLERIDLDFTCPVSINWKPSENVLGGTPCNPNSVAGSIIDNSPPVLLRTYCENDSTVILCFNETIEPSDIDNLLNYSVSPSVSVIHAEIADITNLKVLLRFSTSLLKNTIYELTVSGIHDCAGNLIIPGSNARFGLDDSVAVGDLTINEILFDPFEGSYDFIELYNKRHKIIDLHSVKIASINPESNLPDELANITEDPWLLFPGDYIVITENPESVAQTYRSVYPYQFIKTDNLPAMNVDEGYIAIICKSERIDEVKYLDDYHFQLIEETKGISLEKINPLMNSMQSSSWHSTAPISGYATPGFINSQYSDLLDKEKSVTVNPEIFSPDNDGNDDVITFCIKAGEPGYISNIWFYNSSGEIIFNNSKNNLLPSSSIFTWDGVGDNGSIAPIGLYIALVEIFNLNGNIEKFKLPFVIARKL